MNKSVVLVHPFSGNRTFVPPLGVLYVAAALRQAGYTVRVLEMDLGRVPDSTVTQAISELDPVFVGIPCNIVQVSEVVRLSRVVKATGATVVVGGPMPTVVPERILKEPCVDICVRGEGEITAVELADAIHDGRDWRQIKGLSYRRDSDHVVHTPDRPFVRHLDSLPFPAHDLNLPPGAYSANATPAPATPLVAVLPARGCPFNCSFCSNVWRRQNRRRSAQNVVAELEWLVNAFGVKQVFFYDDTFNSNPAFVRELSQSIVDRHLHIGWRADCRANRKLVDLETLRLAKAAGCWLLAFGVESGNRRILERIRKQLKLEDVERARELCREAGILFRAFFMIGSLGEDYGTVFDTFKFAQKLDVDDPQFSIFTPVVGTDAHTEALRNGWIVDDNWDNHDSFHATVDTDTLSREDVIALHEMAHLLFPQWWKPSLEGQRLRIPDVEQRLKHKYGRKGEMLWQMWQIHLRHGRLENPVVVVSPPDPAGITVGRDTMGGFGQTFRGEYAPVIPPVDMALLAGKVRAEGQPVVVIDANASKLDREHTLKFIAAMAPSKVYVRTTVPTRHWDETLADELRKRNRVDVELFGPAVGVSLLDSDLDALPLPAWDLFPRYNLGPMTDGLDFLPINGSVGCPYACDYCPYPVAQGRKYRRRSPDLIVQEMRHWRDLLGVRHFIFRDPVFSLNREHVESICRGLLGEGITWRCETRADLLDQDLLRLMARAGCTGLNIAIESTTEDVLGKVHRKAIDLDKVRETVRIAKELDVQCFVFYVVGLPGETRESFLATVEFARELDTPFVQFLPVMAYPGTALSAYASERGYIYDQLDAPPHYGSLPLMRNETLTREEIAELVRYGQHAVSRRHLEKKQSRNNVAAAACRSYDDAEKAVRRAVDLLGGMAQFVGRGQRVLVKPNLIGSYSPEKAATTHPAVVEAVVRLVQEVGGIPVVGDSPGSGELAAYKDLSVVHRITGMAEVARRTGANLVDFSQGGVETIDLKGRVLKSVTVARAVLDADVIISVPKLKTHAFTYFTGAIKNIFGIVPGLGKAECHRLAPSPEEFGNLLIDLHLLLGDKLKLVVMDGVVGMEGRGPTHGQPRAGNFILAGRDSLHVDLVACNLVGLDHTQSVPLQVAMDRRNLDNVEVLLIGDSRESIGAARFKAPLFESQDSFTATFAGIRPHIDPVVCQHCDRCRTACPMGAISESHVIDPERCIKCLCCFEMCKSSAVQLVRAAAGDTRPAHAIKASADIRATLPESPQPQPADTPAVPDVPSIRARVLLISNLYPPHFIGGYEVAAKDVADGLSARGYEVRVLTSMFGLDVPARNDGVARVLDHSYGRPGNSVMADPVFSAYNEYAIKAEVAGFKPDLIYLWNFHGLSMLSVMRTVLETGIPYVFHAMDYHLIVKPGDTPSWLENTIRAFLSQERCRTVVMSDTVRGKFDACGFPNLRLVYHGVKQLFERSASHSDALRLLFVGALVQGKGLHLLVQALEKVRAVDPRVTLDVYGAGDRGYENQLRRMVEEARLPVSFHGSVPHDEILPLYSNFDALVLPTLREEPFGIVMIEAMASGLPVIATSAGGPTEVVVPGETGYLFKLGNADDLAEAILRLVADRNQVAVMGNTARRLVQEKFLFEHTLDGIESVFGEVVPTIRPKAVSLCQTSPKATGETVRPVPSETPESPSQGPGAARSILWVGAVLDPSGYADEVRNFVLELRAQGFHVAARCVTRHSKTFVRQLDSKTRMRLDEALTTRIQPGFVSVLHLPAYALQKVPDAAYNIGRTMFETDGLPPGWAARCNAMDEIWVPATFNLETFRNAGVTSRIVVVPGGIDVDRFRPGCRPLPIPEARGTVYLSVFEWIYRKGWDVLLRAWAEAFTPKDDVTLVLRTYPLNAFDGHDAEQEINRRIDRFLRSEVGRNREDVAPIIVLGEQVPDEDLPRLFAAANAYVAPSRGEGWGRPYMQAMACGLPVIATRWSGNLEFMNDENSLLLDIEGLVSIDERAELDFYRGQKWAEPSVGHLKELLRWVHRNPALASTIGERARRDMVENWQWKRVAAIAAQRLNEITAQLASSLPVLVDAAAKANPAVPPQARRVAAVVTSGTEVRPNGHHGRGGAPLAVRWEGSQFVRHSLALVNRELCIRLAQDPGIELSIIPYEGHEFGPEADPRFRLIADRLNCPLTGAAEIHVRHQWPPSLTPPPEGRWVVMQPWEYGSIPKDWIEAWRDRIDDIWAYTGYVRDCYVRSGIPSDRVHVIPIGVDVEKFHPDARPLPLKTQKRFKFLFVGGTIWRKGIDVLLKAYAAVFGANDDVCLVIKDVGSQSFYRDNPLQETITHYKARANEPEIEYIDRTLDDEELAGLYAACDCLVHPYRGEGFGLPLAEAMASGLPVIVTGYGAAMDFCGADTAFLIPARKVRGAEKLVGDLETVDKPWWAEPDLEALSKLLRFVVEHPAEARARGKAARVHIESRFTWEHSARSIKERLQALSREPIRRRGPSEQLPATQRADSRETPQDVQLAARARFVEKWARQLASENSRREPLGVK